MEQRKSGIELLRLVAMLMILLLHANYITFGIPTSQEISENALAPFLRIFSEHSCAIAVNLYVFITGWFGIKPKVKSITNLLIQIITYSFLINICYRLYTKQEITIDNFYNIIVVGKEYWFIISYLLLYILSPVLNSFTDSASKQQFKLVLFFYFAIEFIYGWGYSLEGFLYGYSVISFIGIYLLARYANKYGLKIDKLSKPALLLCFLITTAISSFIVYHSVKNDIQLESSKIVAMHMAYDSPFIIFSTICFFYIFQKLDFTNKVINYLSKSSLAVYLIHVNPIVLPFYIFEQASIHMNHPDLYGLSLMLGFSLLVLFGCIVIDKIRILITPLDHIVSIVTKAGDYIKKYL